MEVIHYGEQLAVKPGDIAVDQNGQIVLVTAISYDTKQYKDIIRGLSVRAVTGETSYREVAILANNAWLNIVTNIGALLDQAEATGVKFTVPTGIDPNLAGPARELAELKANNAALEARLLKLEKK
jgi:hypothetical protein